MIHNYDDDDGSGHEALNRELVMRMKVSIFILIMLMHVDALHSEMMITMSGKMWIKVTKGNNLSMTIIIIPA